MSWEKSNEARTARAGGGLVIRCRAAILREQVPDPETRKLTKVTSHR
jgi:hypothetical protein